MFGYFRMHFALEYFYNARGKTAVYGFGAVVARATDANPVDADAAAWAFSMRSPEEGWLAPVTAAKMGVP